MSGDLGEISTVLVDSGGEAGLNLGLAEWKFFSRFCFSRKALTKSTRCSSLNLSILARRRLPILLNEI
jgi:hypothetical protein